MIFGLQARKQFVSQVKWQITISRKVAQGSILSVFTCCWVCCSWPLTNICLQVEQRIHLWTSSLVYMFTHLLDLFVWLTLNQGSTSFVTNSRLHLNRRRSVIAPWGQIIIMIMHLWDWTLGLTSLRGICLNHRKLDLVHHLWLKQSLKALLH